MRSPDPLYIQLYSPECTLAENIDINNNKQNKDRNILITQPQWGPTSKGDGREGREERGDGKGGEGIFPP